MERSRQRGTYDRSNTHDCGDGGDGGKIYADNTTNNSKQDSSYRVVIFFFTKQTGHPTTRNKQQNNNTHSSDDSKHDSNRFKRSQARTSARDSAACSTCSNISEHDAPVATISRSETIDANPKKDASEGGVAHKTTKRKEVSGVVNIDGSTHDGRSFRF